MHVEEALTTERLLRHVREALTEASKLAWNELTSEGDVIASAIAKRLKDNPNIFCYSGKPASIPEGCTGSEWLFHFCALAYKEPAGVRFLVQGAIVGEIEWCFEDAKTDEGFEKLLIVDSIVCFFVCGVRSREQANEKLARYEKVVKIRQKYAALRGIRPPSFLLACYVRPDDHISGHVELIPKEIPGRSLLRRPN